MAATKRMRQLGEQIKEIIATIFARGEVSDPRLRHITIHSVQMTPDLQLAKVYYNVSVLAQVNQADVTTALKSASGFIRREVGKNLSIRFTPEIVFYYDSSLDYAHKINSILTKIKEESDDNNGNKT